MLLYDSLLICFILIKPVIVYLDVDDLAVTQQAVQDGGGDHRISKQLPPVSGALV